MSIDEFFTSIATRLRNEQEKEERIKKARRKNSPQH